MAFGGDAHDLGTCFGRWVRAVAAAANHYESRCLLDLIRSYDDEPMLPKGAIDFLGGPPGLRFEIDDVGRVAGAALRRDNLPGIGRVGFGDVVVERRPPGGLWGLGGGRRGH